MGQDNDQIVWDVFISHASERLELARAIKAQLRKSKALKVFLTTPDDDSSLGPGEWREQIEKAIPNTRLVLLLLDDKANDSEPVLDELIAARRSAAERGIPEIAPIALNGFGLGETRSSLRPELRWVRDFTLTKYDTRNQSSGPLAKTISRFVGNLLSKDRPEAPRGYGSSEGAGSEQLADRIASSAERVVAEGDAANPETAALCAGILEDAGALLDVARREYLESGGNLSERDAGVLERIVSLGRRAAANPESADRSILSNLEDVARLVGAVFGRDEISEKIYAAWEGLGYVRMGVDSPSDEPYVTVDMVSPATTEPPELSRFLDDPLSETLRSSGKPDRLLMPLLGTGALQLESNDDPESECSGEVITWDLAVEREISARSEAHRNFLAELKSSRLDGRRAVGENRAPSLVSEARIALFDLAYTMTTVFIDGFASNPAPITDWGDHSVAIDKEALASIVGRCSSAIKALDALENDESGDHDLLGRRDLLRKLQEVSKDIQLFDYLSEDPHLSGSRVEWVTDTFWHSMIFDSPVYPRMDELALQVALVDASTKRGHAFTRPLRRLEPSASVARTKLETFENTIARSVRRGYVDCMALKDTPHSPRHSFYLSMAAALMSDYNAWVWDEREDHVDGFPIALVTTFDLELERALANSAIGDAQYYHVALPVLTDVGGNKARLRWVIGTFPSHRGFFLPHLNELASPAHGWEWLDSFSPDDSRKMPLEGPLILKINGSPLHQLPVQGHGGRTPNNPVQRTSAECTPQHHAITLGEFDIFQASRVHLWADSARHQQERAGETQGLPLWLTRSLQREDRYWLLVGHRLIDWNARMQLFLHMPDRQHDERGTAVNRWFDHDRLRILHWLGIRPVEGDAALLTPWLNEYAEATMLEIEQEG